MSEAVIHRKMAINLEEKVNESFEPMFSSHSRDLVIYGGAGAGKSWAVANKLILKCLKYLKRRVVIIRKYGPSLRRTCFQMVLDILSDWGLLETVRVNNTDMTITYPNGSQMLFLPIVDSGTREPAGRIKSLTDITDMWLEEPTELSFREYQQVALRLRGQELKEGYRQRILTFNPIDKNHWLYSHFFLTARSELCQKYTYHDNRFLEAEFTSELEALKETDPIAYQVYALGEWGTLGNQVYNNYEVAEFSWNNLVLDAVIAGADWGATNPSCWLPIGVAEKTLYIPDEVYGNKNRDGQTLITADLIELVREKAVELNIPLGAIPLYGDSAEPARLEEMERSGFLVYPAEKAVSDGIQAVKGFHIVIHPRCVNTIKEIAGYKFREDRHGNVLDEPLKYNDHAMAALRYAIYSWWLENAGVAYEEEPVPVPDEFEDGRF